MGDDDKLSALLMGLDTPSEEMCYMVEFLRLSLALCW